MTGLPTPVATALANRDWYQLIEALESLSSSAVTNALPTVVGELSTWPDSERQAEPGWIHLLMEEESAPLSHLARALRLHNWDLEGDQVGKLTALSLFANITDLEVDDSSFEGGTVTGLLGTSLGPLSALRLVHFQATDDEVIRLAASPIVSKLVELEVDVSESMDPLLGCASGTLRALRLGSASLTAASAIAVSGAIPRLRELSLDSCVLSDEFAEFVIASDTLERVNIEGCTLSRDSYGKLKKACGRKGWRFRGCSLQLADW